MTHGNPISQDNDGDGNNVLTIQQLLAQQNAAQQLIKHNRSCYR